MKLCQNFITLINNFIIKYHNMPSNCATVIVLLNGQKLIALISVIELFYDSSYCVLHHLKCNYHSKPYKGLRLCEVFASARSVRIFRRYSLTRVGLKILMPSGLAHFLPCFKQPHTYTSNQYAKVIVNKSNADNNY